MRTAARRGPTAPTAGPWTPAARGQRRSCGSRPRERWPAAQSRSPRSCPHAAGAPPRAVVRGWPRTPRSGSGAGAGSPWSRRSRGPAGRERGPTGARSRRIPGRSDRRRPGRSRRAPGPRSRSSSGRLGTAHERGLPRRYTDRGRFVLATEPPTCIHYGHSVRGALRPPRRRLDWVGRRDRLDRHGGGADEAPTAVPDIVTVNDANSALHRHPRWRPTTSRRCQRMIVAGVTSMPTRRWPCGRRMSAAIGARSAQGIRGLGFWRWSTASWWRSTRISVSLAVSGRANCTIQPAGCRTASYISRSATVDHALSWLVSNLQVKAAGRVSGTHSTENWPVWATESGHLPYGRSSRMALSSSVGPVAPVLDRLQQAGTPAGSPPWTTTAPSAASSPRRDSAADRRPPGHMSRPPLTEITLPVM